MLDPYAPVATAVLFPEGVNVPPPKKGLKAETTAGANPPALVGCLSFLVDSFDWEASERPNTPLEDTLVLEIDIPSFDGGPDSSIPADQQGAAHLSTTQLNLVSMQGVQRSMGLLGLVCLLF